jgi:beta-galactosidase
MFYFGADYYPEHWPEERWAEDARLMAEAGFNVVRLAEFAWSRLEPEQDRYEFAWLDRALEVLAGNGIQAVLGTPTASPPPWLMVKYPEAFRVRSDGQRMTYGNRREYCPNNSAYQAASRRIVTQMAQHYAGHPSVIGWQIDNEFGDRCYCPVCANGFQEWLSKRYHSLQDLNAKWGTIFWSHVYNVWSEIPLPLTTGGSPNPGLAIDFYRYQSDSYVAYQQMQVDILRNKCPGHFITHNFMGSWYDNLDYYDLARGLDIVSWDNYPRGFWSSPVEVDPSGMALSHDTMRGLKAQNFWVMEQQQAQAVGDRQRSSRPGECVCGLIRRLHMGLMGSYSSAGVLRALELSNTGTDCSITMGHQDDVTMRLSKWGLS